MCFIDGTANAAGEYTYDPCKNERTQLITDHGCINAARFLCTFVRLFKCLLRTEIERCRLPWIRGVWLMLRAHGGDGTVCFSIEWFFLRHSTSVYRLLS